MLLLDRLLAVNTTGVTVPGATGGISTSSGTDIANALKSRVG